VVFVSTERRGWLVGARRELCNLLPQASAQSSSSAELVDAARSSRSYSPTSQEEEEHQPIVENATERSDAVAREARVGRCAWLRHGAHRQTLTCRQPALFCLADWLALLIGSM